LNSDLEIYIEDHLAGAGAAVEVIGLLLKQPKEPVLTNLLRALLVEIQEDKSTLERLAASMGMGSSAVKDSAAWMGARVVALKTRAGKSPFGAFEALEFLCLGIQGKLHLWRALQQSPAFGSAAGQPDFDVLIRRALEQHRKVDALRLAVATVAL